ERSIDSATEDDIPVALNDRGNKPAADTLYATRSATDNIAVSATVADWAKTALPDGGKYFTLEGPAGVAVVNERNAGWDEGIGAESSFTEVGAQTANCSSEHGKSVYGPGIKSDAHEESVVLWRQRACGQR
ncbi:substrate-binding domain-containing protein, partial [Clavibacter michiganensis]|uniref:substrate-binding domain-containing protein n=1 Tax=Clavibacter michiganensis TaxID=28447 RepID=UPI00292D7333